MIVAIAILAGIGFIFSIFNKIIETEKIGFDGFLAAILVITCWNSCLTISIITLAVCFILIILAIAVNDK